MKILIAGDWHSELHEEAAYQALGRLGHEVFRFSWNQYFQPHEGWLRPIDDALKRAQNKYLAGPQLRRLNRDLLTRVAEVKPDTVFVYRGTHITARTLCEIKRRVPAATLVGYNNDDPFSPLHPGWLWRHFLESIPQYDLVLAYRHANLAEFRTAGARSVKLLRSWYIPDRNHPVELSPSDRERYGCDVMFAGHYEGDGRVKMLEDIVGQGFNVKLYGPPKYWNPVLMKSSLLARLAPVRQVWGEEYNKAIAGAKLALCFLSKLNRDTYTRRCFEIPATGTMMLVEYTEDLASLFKEDEEVAFFRTAEELRDKIAYYVQNDELRSRVAAAGHHRVVSSGHDVESRMRKVVHWIMEMRKAQAA
jgi:hypothetical protein